MDLYCVFGNPIAHSQSPRIHQRFAELTGQALSYTRRLVPLGELASHVAQFQAEGGLGCNITVPFKFDAATLAPYRSERVQLCGAANTLILQDGEWHAENTDGLGLVRDIQFNAGVDLHGQNVLLLGAGGAAAGVLAPLLDMQPQRLVVANRTASKAEQLVASHSALARERGVALQASGLNGIDGQFQVLVNGTSSSLGEGEVPVPPSVLAPGALAYDMMYGPKAQAFADWAHRHGAVARDGLGMLVEQAAAAFALWRGVVPPSRQVLDELRRDLAA